MRLTLSPAGEFSHVRVAESSGHLAFDQWATRVIEGWKCPPSQRAAPVEVETSIEFRLR